LQIQDWQDAAKIVIAFVHYTRST